MRLLIVMLLLMLPATGFAQVPQREMSMPDEPAFVEHRLTLQLSDAAEAKQAIVLSVAANLLKAFGPDKVAIDVVAFGPGIDLLHDGNPNAAKIRSLVAQGVRFDACMNTVDTIERETGKPYVLAPESRRVDSGVVQIITLAEHGYTTVRP